MNSSSTVSIRDYIVDLQTEKNLSKLASTYEVVLQNNTDFIISRKTAKSERELVILISQCLFYFKDTKSGAIEDITISKLKSFLRDLKDDTLPLDQVHWLPELTKESAERISQIISDKTFVDMCKHNVMGDVRDPEWYGGYWEQNSKLFIKLHEMFPTITDSSNGKYRSSFPIIFELDKLFGYNEAMYFAEKLVLSGVERYASGETRYNYTYGYSEAIDCTGFLKLLEEPYNLNLRRLIDYVLFDLYSQGIAQVDGAFWKEYEDYLRMQIQIFGKIREKFPKHLKTEHDIMTLKVNAVKAIEKCEGFEMRANEVEELAYQGKTYSIIVPKHPQEIADEGVNLSHCVGSYVDRIINGECHILFLRKTRTPDQSLVTLQLCNKRINQAEGNKRRNITDEERKFLKLWSREKKISFAV